MKRSALRPKLADCPSNLARADLSRDGREAYFSSIEFNEISNISAVYAVALLYSIKETRSKEAGVNTFRSRASAEMSRIFQIAVSWTEIRYRTSGIHQSESLSRTQTRMTAVPGPAPFLAMSFQAHTMPTANWFAPRRPYGPFDSEQYLIIFRWLFVTNMRNRSFRKRCIRRKFHGRIECSRARSTRDRNADLHRRAVSNGRKRPSPTFAARSSCIRAPRRVSRRWRAAAGTFAGRTAAGATRLPPAGLARLCSLTARASALAGSGLRALAARSGNA